MLLLGTLPTQLINIAIFRALILCLNFIAAFQVGPFGRSSFRALFELSRFFRRQDRQFRNLLSISSHDSLRFFYLWLIFFGLSPSPPTYFSLEPYQIFKYCLLCISFRQGIYLSKSSKVFCNIRISLFNCLPSSLLFFLGGQFILFACHHAKVSAFLSHPNGTLFELFIDTHQHKCVIDEALFDVPVQWGVSGKRRCVIDLKDYGLNIFVDDHIKAEKLIAHVSPIVLGLARPILEFEMRQARNESFNYDIMNFSFEFNHVHSFFCHYLEHCLQGSFMTDAHIIFILIENEFFIFFVYCVICEVHAHILHVFFIGSNVGLRCEPAQTFSEDKYTEWVDSSYQYIDAQIKLQAIDEKRTAQISLYHTMLLRIDVFQLPSEENSLPLGKAFRLYNISSGFSFRFGLKVGSEILIIAGKVPSQREVIILLGCFFPHLHEVLREEVFARERIHSREVINLLVMLHFHECFWRNGPVSPPDIPLSVIRVCFDLPFQLLPYFGDHFILAVLLKVELPETFITIRSKRITFTQLGANLGMMV